MGETGPAGSPGPEGPIGPQGPPGEVSLAQLAASIQDTGRNPASVQTLSLIPNDPPSVSDFLALQDKINESILAVRR